MATTTPNFGWAVPTSSDLVKNGATAIETLGDSIDASLVDLKGGTSGQVLAKASNTDMDFSWVTDASGIPATILDAKGDIIAATAADTASRLAVGTNGQVLTADSTAATGLKWAAAGGGGSGSLVFISSTSFTSATSVSLPTSTFTSTYDNYLLIFDTTSISTTMTVTGRLRASGTDNSTANYHSMITLVTNGGTTSIVAVAGLTAFNFQFGASGKPYQGLVNVQSPFLTKQTVILQNMLTQNTAGADRTAVTGGGEFGDTTSFDSFSLIASTGNFTGTVKVYGYVNS